jgi:hypothetical protein
MNKTRVDKLLKDINTLDTEELVEVRNIIGSMINIRRSLSVLSGHQERPGRRGRRWKDTQDADASAIPHTATKRGRKARTRGDAGK